MERATHALGPTDVGIGRLLGGAAVLACVWMLQRGAHRVGRGDLVRIAGLALVSTSLPFVVQPYCLSRGFGHSYFGVMIGLVPIATIIVSIPILGVWPTARQVVGVVGGFVCMVLLVQDGSARGMPAGLLALALSVPVCYALGNTYLKWKLSHVHSVPFTTVALAMAAGWLILLRLAPGAQDYFGLYEPAHRHDWAAAIASILVLGTVGTGVAVLLFNWLVVKEGPLFAGMVTYVVPTVALVWGAVDGETITSRQLVAMAGVLAMVALVQVSAKAVSAVAADDEQREPHFCPSDNPAVDLGGGVERACKRKRAEGSSLKLR